ncbi:hypothetical protein LUZ61_008367 [Rhynchospora tenuis]|uniref:CBS domain-containing protein n=1 Tax=Rhynchospora tenuis TaxID=198213 RepID=A0AAD5ZVF3_9POAL|nr:hypothetical protein LUZ61_008367 [Rhynchospora tenuis]
MYLPATSNTTRPVPMHTVVLHDLALQTWERLYSLYPHVNTFFNTIGAVFEGDIIILISKSGAQLLSLVTCAKAKVTSAAAQMIFGDTIVAAAMAARKVAREQYAANHPAGKIGKSLIFKVKDVMKKKEDLPICKEGDMIMDQLSDLTSKGCGCLLVIDDSYRLIVTFTDGDLRRALKANGADIFKLTVGQMCNRNPRTITADAMLVQAMQKMESPPSLVQFLPVIDCQNVVIGIVTLHGLVSSGLSRRTLTPIFVSETSVSCIL